MGSRRERIEQMLTEDPSDLFLRYSLALELEKEGEHERSLELLRGLMANETPYVLAFFMAGQQLARLDRLEEVREVVTSGIEQAQQQGEDHAAREMTEFLANL